MATLGLALGSAASVATRRTPVVEVVEKVLPSVVNIGTERLVKVRYSDPSRRFRGDLFDQFFSDFFGAMPSPGYRVAHSLGSGVVIDPSGYILTNFHVIERASKIRVTLADESSYDAVFVAGDEVNDLALLKIEPAQPLPAVRFAAVDDLMLGETVIALGNPFGLAHTVTVGVLSAKNREARYGGQVLFNDILQTDAAVNPGSSGGPLLNMDGEVIGINVAIYREAQNIGFAVPIRRARALVAKWLEPRNIGKRTIGFEPEFKDNALKVVSAASGAVRPGDVIQAVGGTAVTDLYDFHRALLAYPAGSEVPMTVERGGQPEPVKAAMSVLPKPEGGPLAKKLLGLEFAAAGEGGQGGVRLSMGLAVAAVADGGAAQKAGLRPGLWVTRINENEIRSLDDVGVALENVKAGDAVTVGVLSLEESGSFLVAQSSVVPVKAE